MPPRCQNRKIRSGSVTLLHLSIFPMRNIQKIHAPSRKIFPKNHCYFSEFRIYWEVYRSFLPAPQAGELSSCTAASGGKQAGKAKLPSPPFFAVFLFCRYSFFQRRYHVGIFLFPGALSVWCLDGFLSFTKMNEVMSAVRGTARMTPMLLAMPLMTSVAI